MTKIVGWITDISSGTVYFDMDVEGRRANASVLVRRFPERERFQLRVGQYIEIDKGAVRLWRDTRPAFVRNRAYWAACQRATAWMEYFARNDNNE